MQPQIYMYTILLFPGVYDKELDLATVLTSQMRFCFKNMRSDYYSCDQPSLS